MAGDAGRVVSERNGRTGATALGVRTAGLVFIAPVSLHCIRRDVANGN